MVQYAMHLTEWKFRGSGEADWLPAQVPGCVHTDLLRNGLIADPFYGTNEHGLQWIDKKDWEYETSFDADPGLLASEHVRLVFDGLDTYADVYVNGKHVLAADNMFRSWTADVKGLLAERDNKLFVRFRSPVHEDLPKLERLGYDLPAANDQSELGGLGDRKISVFARKAPYHYGWDWGPRFVTSGIWRPVRLEAWSGSRITDLYIRQDDVSASEARLTAVVEIEAGGEGAGLLRVRTGQRVWEAEAALAKGVRTVEVPIVIEQPELWWCRGLGEPHLYAFEAELIAADGRRASVKQAETGLRSARLVREKDEAGASFYFELNGVPVFAKGANHIPNDSFITEVTEERYRQEIVSAVKANMNMVRVWGGGVYEDDAFYRLCDEHGLLVWQDFMFACSMYPGDQAFLDSVKAEAEYNVKRLRNHPSVVLWCGNNEIDSAWAHYDEDAGWGWKKQYTPELREKIWADYEALFHRLLPDVVERLSPGIDYWPSSPLVRLSGDKEQHAHPLTGEGDIHYWGVWHNVEPFENYKAKIGRFMSEYGFQSFPEYRTVRTFAEESDMELESAVMLAHQKNGNGNRLIKEYMDIYMKEPKDFPSFLYMSQVLQAEAMKTAIEAHRRKKPYCMGSLYWQVNDCWPVASWAGIDYYGRWKALHYYAKRSFADLLLSVDQSDDRLDFYVVSDLKEQASGELRLRLFDMAGNKLGDAMYDYRVEAGESRIVWSAEKEALLQEADPAGVVLLAELLRDGRTVCRDTVYFVGDKALALEPASIRVKREANEDGVRYTLETDRLAKQVWLSADAEGIFTDNFFDLIPGVPYTVEFQAGTAGLGEAAPDAGAPAVTARSMIDFVRVGTPAS